MLKEHQHSDILIPKFASSQMVKKGQRIINKTTVRSMIHWSHFRFRMRLINKAEQLGARVHVVSEHYTSKTCTNCHFIKWNLGGNKSYVCPSCEMRIPRDFNGARNIFVMNFVPCIGPFVA